MNFNKQLRAAIECHDYDLILKFYKTLPKVSINDNSSIKRNCNINNIQFLVDRGIDIDYFEYMMCAICNWKYDVIRYLLENKYIDPAKGFYFEETCNETWLNYIIYAYVYGQFNRTRMNNDDILNLVKLFVEFGANIHDINENGKNMMHYILGDINDGDCNDGYYNIDPCLFPVIKYLIANKMDPNTQNSKLYTPLHCLMMNYAFFPMETAMIIFLVRNGADLNLGDRYNNTPLHNIVLCYDSMTHGHDLEILHMMLESGANPHIVNAQGLTPYSISTKSGVHSVIKSYMDDLPVKGVNNG